jgi:hypothetical protein
LFARNYRSRRFHIVETDASHFIDFVQLAKSLTRRANQGHKYIIAKIVKPARSNPRRAFSLRSSHVEFFESDGGRLSRRRISQRPTPGRRGRAVVRTTSIAHHPENRCRSFRMMHAN